jgi:Fe-S-cluster-containing hydrogenase component 2
MVQVRKDLCTGCGFCAANCPQQAISLVTGQAKIDRSRCNGCRLCIELCPQGAIIEKAPVSTQELHTTVTSMSSRANELIERIEKLKTDVSYPCDYPGCSVSS